MLSLKKIAFVVLIPVSAVVATAAAIALSSTCAHAGQCGQCYVTGRPGINVWRGKYSDCDVCETVKPDLTIAGREGVPGPRAPKKKDIRRFA